MHDRSPTYLADVNLLSDTFTMPDAPMLEAMRNAESGDDCYGQDPTVKELQEYAANYFGKEAALFFPTGTMTNLVAMKTLLVTGGEVIADRSCHVNVFESDQFADFAGVIFNLCSAPGGILTVEKLEKMIDSKFRKSPLYPKPKIVIVENTINSHGGKIFPLEALKELYAFTSTHGLILYMDGARLFNACVESGKNPMEAAKEYAQYTDYLAVCLSKGLGAPTGSMLLGKKEMIDKAQEARKHVGGSMHQAGYMAAAGLYAIKNNVERLRLDHDNIRLLAKTLKAIDGIQVINAETNMILINVKELGVNAQKFVDLAKERGVQLLAWQENVVRFVTHLNVDRDEVLRAEKIVTRLIQDLKDNPELAKTVTAPENANALLALLQEKGVSCEKSSANAQVINVKLDGAARAFCTSAATAGFKVGVTSKDIVSLKVTAEFSKDELANIADSLATVYLHHHKTPAAAAAAVEATPSVEGMFGSRRHSSKHTHHSSKHSHSKKHSHKHLKDDERRPSRSHGMGN